MNQAQAEQGLREQWDHDAAARRAMQNQPLHMNLEKNMKLKEMLESKYLQQEDVDGEVVVTVHALKKVNVAKEDETPEYKWTVKFQEFAKPMVANATNVKRMFKALGEDSEEWLGKQIILYVDPDVEFGGKIVGGLRVRGIRKSVAPAKAGQRSEDDVNSELNDQEIPF
jgi:hypothetical protein